MAIAPYPRNPMKLRKLHIEDYKMFKDFDISFVDENDEPLPIVVLAGVNGSGKTTLLEFLYSNFDILHRGDKDYIEYIEFDFRQNKYILKIIGNKPSNTRGMTFAGISELEKAQKIENAKKNKTLIYFLVEVNDSRKLEKEFVKYWYNQVKFYNKRNDEITESLQKFIKESFEGLDLHFTYSHIDEDDNIFFQNDNNEKFKISELSTGEQTLLSKVLYLFLKEYKNQVILIDEPELSLHPKWQNQILKIYKNFALKNECQIIIATHSPHIITNAENQYIRFLEKNNEGNVVAMNDIQAYGRDIEWVLQQMGVTDTRLPKITKRFEEIQELINNQEFDKADDELDKLEYVIGDNDKDILALRNDLAFERMDFEEDN